LIESPRLALPDYEDGPALFLEGGYEGAVAAPITPDFGRPEVKPGLGELSITASVSVPKAAVHENNLSPAGKDQVGAAGQFRGVKPVAVTHAVDEASHDHLGDGVFTANAPHERAALFRGARIDHQRFRAFLIAVRI
jgi:hypothetical protein